MDYLKKFKLILFTMIIHFFGYQSVESATAGIPNKPTISILKNWTEGGYDVQWNKWSGTDATKWSLTENGKTVYTGTLTPSTDGHQSGSYASRNPPYGVFTYQVTLANASGQVTSDAASFAVDGASLIVADSVDINSQALQLTLNLSQSLDLPIRVIGTNSPSLKLSTNHAGIFSYTLKNANTITLKGLQSGRGSLLIQDTVTGYTRFIGIRVKDSKGNLPGLPSYIAMGSVSEDTTDDLNFWKQFGNDNLNRWVDIRYIYLNGGPKSQGGGWRTWTTVNGFRATSYIRESLKLGMIPFFVYYNIPDGGESYTTDKQHLESQSYMEGYFTDLKFALDLCNKEAKDEIVGFVLEPDCLGYFSQNNEKPDAAVAQTSAAYTSGVLTSSDPAFPNTLKGTVQAINYIIRKNFPPAYFGWQANLWASPPGGFTIPVPGNGVIHLTDTMGVDKGRPAIMREAAAIADYYINAGIFSSGANFISIDKYGLDAGAEGKWDNPATSTWFWNAVHWTNYLQFVKALSIRTKLPVILWQLPVGHINNSLAVNPYSTDKKFTPLTNTTRQFEDSAPTYFLGDQFTTSGNRLTFFSQDDSLSNVTVQGSTITWDSHVALASKSGVNAILFGAGVGDSTDGVGSPPSDNYWWIVKVQGYFKNPVSICSLTNNCPTDADLPAPDSGSGGNDGSGGNTGSGQITNFPATLSYTQTKTSSWNTGAQFDTAFKNTGNKTISNIQVKIMVPPSALSIWSVSILTSDSTSTTIGLPSWQTTLAPGQTFSFGYVVQLTTEPNVTFISMTEK